jgi:hypothetical protein
MPDQDSGAGIQEVEEQPKGWRRQVTGKRGLQRYCLKSTPRTRKAPDRCSPVGFLVHSSRPIEHVLFLAVMRVVFQSADRFSILWTEVSGL